MNDPIPADDLPDGLASLAGQPTGSGVADLEIAFERMKLADAADDAVADGVLPTGDAAAESEAHPS